MQSSLGFHTMELSLAIFKDHTDQLLEDFKKYSQKTGLIKMYSDNLGNEIVYFYGRDEGIHWKICHDVRMGRFGDFFDMVKVTINPKILSGTISYITAATCADMNVAICNFNAISKQISPLLEIFDHYKINRIDYCINFSLNEIISDVNPDLVMNLIKRGDIPAHYKELMQYDNISHRKKSLLGSFYLINNSVNINCYCKYMQLSKRSRENTEKGYAPIVDDILYTAQDIIRFEIQCKYHKIYALSSKVKESKNNERNKYKDLLSSINCITIVSDYYKKIIGKGDWYTLHEAVQIIKSKCFNSQKERRLIDALQLVNRCRSLAKAKASLQDHELEAFKRTLNELANLGINPVTIPKDWNIKHIPNLLRTYFDKVLNEDYTLSSLSEDFFASQAYNEYVEAFNHPPI